MTVRVKLSSKHQITVPADIRRELAIEAGDQLIVSVRNGVIVMVPFRGDAVEQLGGLHREIWEGEAAQDYVNQERDAWEKL